MQVCQRALLSPINRVCPSSLMDSDTLLQGHRGSVVHLQTFYSSTPKSLPGTDSALDLQTVGGSTQRTYGLYHSPKCCWLEQHGLREVSGPLNNLLQPHARTYGVTACILTKPRPHQAGEKLVPWSAVFFQPVQLLFPLPMGLRIQRAAPQLLQTRFGS